MAKGILLNGDAFRRTRDVVLEVERARGRRAPDARRRQPPGSRPPIRAILLDDCPSETVVDAVITEAVETPEIQQITLEGEPSGGTFTLTFSGATTTDLDWNCTAEAMQAALEKLETVGSGAVRVTIGKTVDHNPGVWLVEFSGRLADVDVPLIETTNNVDGTTMFVAATTVWMDTGRLAQVRSAIPLGTPTPLRAGAVVLCQWFNVAGYCVISAEARPFNPYGS